MSFYYYDYNNGGGNQNRRGFLSNVPDVTRNLIIINCLVFLATIINEEMMVGSFALFYPKSPFFRPWQIITHMFMHGGFMHILFNMYTLYIFGSMVERMIGSRKFFVFYFLCGLGSAGLYMMVQDIQATVWLSQAPAFMNGDYLMLLRTPMLGASGAIYGLIIAYAMMFPQQRLTLLFPPVTMNAKTMVIVFACLELAFGLLSARGTISTGVANFAHLGGMLLGWGIIYFWRRRGVLFDHDRWY